MKKFLFTAAAFCLLFTLLISCHKPDSIPTQSTYTFTNQTGRRVTFDVYDTKEDYSRNANRLQQYIIEPGANQKVVFDVQRKYWIDWYSAGYSFSNWQSTRSSYNRSFPLPELNIAAQDDAIAIKAGAQDTTRSVLVGSGQSSTWLIRVTDNSLINGDHRFVFRKDFTGEYTYTDVNGASNVTLFEYWVSGTSSGSGIQQQFIVSVQNAQSATIFRVTCNPGTQYMPHTGRDTLMIRFQQLNIFTDYAAVRQQ